ncbi:hypothetical protein EXIGLDRAFT_719748 [Exidia glandulosa HHB12029]|uniref:Uncharacterized protein n=1 Tax=Exidia glandulosa HHB12029 TaxID=1314781 RepID=A0A165GUB1_EXIGL|nr:hypothetical protein EXIGLDRAFT_719748 [Exidia glandulosa HHB12029]
MSAARPNTDSSTVSRVLAGTTLALKVAREATDSVSIAKQILGSAAHISEFAEKIEKNRKAMNDLIAKSAGYACHIDTIVAGRIVEGKVLSNLRRLCSVFTRIEALVAEAAAVKNGVKRRLHNIFIAPNKASDLASELEREMQLFQVAMTLDMRLAINETAEETLRAIHENDLYDCDGFRRLRPADVRKLDDLPTDQWQEDNNVAFSKARVDGELMVIRCPRSSGPLPSAWATNLDIVKELSRHPITQHANVIQLYGRSVNNPDSSFVAFRSGCHTFKDYVEQHKANMSPLQKVAKAFETAIKLLDAVKHLERVSNIGWYCHRLGIFAGDDECNPTIGLFDDLRPKSGVSPLAYVRAFDWAAFSWFATRTYHCCVVHDLQVFRALVAQSNVPKEIAQILQRLQDVYLRALCRSQSIPIDYSPTSLAPATVEAPGKLRYRSGLTCPPNGRVSGQILGVNAPPNGPSDAPGWV